MATNIPPHNLAEVIDGIIATIDNPDITIEELMNCIQGAGFPDGGADFGPRRHPFGLYDRPRAHYYARTGGNRRTMSETKNRIVVTELPYQVNKARLIEKIADLVHEKRLEGISDLRDESDRDGYAHRHRTEARRKRRNVVLNNLYKYTQDAGYLRRDYAGARE